MIAAEPTRHDRPGTGQSRWEVVMDAHATAVDQGRSIDVRAVLALLLAVASIALLGLAFLGGASTSRGTAELIVYGSPTLWVLAAIALAPRSLARHAIAGLAIAGYAIAFVLPAISRGDQSYPGYLAFVVGVQLVPIAWLANPAFLIALGLYRGAEREAAVIVGIVASLLAVTALGMPNWNGWGPTIGFWAWALSPAVLAVAALARAQDHPVPERLPDGSR